MKKRIVSLMLAVLMVLSLTACGAKPGPTEPAVTTAQTTAVPTEEPTTAPTEPENVLALGVVDGNTYLNTYAGIGCTLDDNWVLHPAEDLQELPEMTKEMVKGTELENILAGVTQFTDMYAENVELLATVNVLFQKLELNQRLAYALMDEKEVLEATLEQKDLMIQAYAQAGINTESMEIITVTFLGEEHYALKTVAENQGVPYYCLQVFNFWLGQYSTTITFASFVEDNTENLLELFYAAE